jgi:hypothetical protein
MSILELLLILIAASIPSASFWVVGVIYLNVGYNHKGPHNAILLKEYVSACQDKYGHKYKCSSSPYHISQDFVYLKDPSNSNSSFICTIGREFGYPTRNDANNHVNNINKQIADGVIYTRTVYGSVGNEKFCLDQKLVDYYKQVGWGCMAPVFLLYAFFILIFILDCGSSESETTCCKMCGCFRDCCSATVRWLSSFCRHDERRGRDQRHQYEPTSSTAEPSAVPATPRTASRATVATASRFSHSQSPNTEDDIELANVTAVIDDSTSFKAETVALPVDVMSDVVHV